MRSLGGETEWVDEAVRLRIHTHGRFAAALEVLVVIGLVLIHDVVISIAKMSLYDLLVK